MSEVDNAGGGAAGGAGSSGKSKAGRHKDTCKSLDKPHNEWCAGCLGTKRKCTFNASGDSATGGLAEFAAASCLPAAGAAAASHEAGTAPLPDGQGRHRRARAAGNNQDIFTPPANSLRDRGGRCRELRDNYAEDRRVDEQTLVNFSVERCKSAGDPGAAEALPAATPPSVRLPLALPAAAVQAGPFSLPPLSIELRELK